MIDEHVHRRKRVRYLGLALAAVVVLVGITLLANSTKERFDAPRGQAVLSAQWVPTLEEVSLADRDRTICFDRRTKQGIADCVFLSPDSLVDERAGPGDEVRIFFDGPDWRGAKILRVIKLSDG